MSNKELLQLEQIISSIQEKGKLLLNKENKAMLERMNKVKKQVEKHTVQETKEQSVVPFLETSGL
jgi:hypothetical protein